MTTETADIIDRIDPSIYPSRRIAVAMSGGVDSSLSAALLKDAGFDVMGITIRLSDGIHNDNDPDNSPVTAAQSVAEHLGIQHIAVDFRKTFKKCVIEYFASEYIATRTPNPCVYCNRVMKWDFLGETARSMGYDLLATGHYVRIGRFKDGTCSLFRGIDETKD